MQKTAQQRGFFNKLREMTNISGIAAEKFFDPEFKKVMESLRQKDNSIRAMVSGKEIEGADPGPDAVSLKDLFKSAKSNFNRREYMTAVAELGRFHKKMFDVVQFIKALGLDVDKVHHEFLFKELGEEHKKQLADMQKRFAQQQQLEIVKEAGIMDFFYEVGTKRGRALATWEKRYPKKTAKLKKDTATLLGKTEGMLSQTLSALKEMASARAVRNVDNYVKAADKITKGYQGYDAFFREYYKSNIKDFLEKVELSAPTEKAPAAKEMGEQEVPTGKKEEAPGSTMPFPLVKKEPTVSAGPPSMEEAPTILAPSAMTPAIPSAPKAPVIEQPTTQPELPPVPSLPAPKPPTAPALPVSHDSNVPPPPPGAAEEIEELGGSQLAKVMREYQKKSHQKFLASLEALGSESPVLLASYIQKYAKSIQNTNPEMAISLFKIVKSIRG